MNATPAPRPIAAALQANAAPAVGDSAGSHAVAPATDPCATIAVRIAGSSPERSSRATAAVGARPAAMARSRASSIIDRVYWSAIASYRASSTCRASSCRTRRSIVDG